MKKYSEQIFILKIYISFKLFKNHYFKYLIIQIKMTTQILNSRYEIFDPTNIRIGSQGVVFFVKDKKAFKLFKKTVLEDSLEKRGRLNQIRAKIRSEIFSSLEDNNDQIPKLPHENLLINEIIREYLEFNE